MDFILIRCSSDVYCSYSEFTGDGICRFYGKKMFPGDATEVRYRSPPVSFMSNRDFQEDSQVKIWTKSSASTVRKLEDDPWTPQSEITFKDQFSNISHYHSIARSYMLTQHWAAQKSCENTFFF